MPELSFVIGAYVVAWVVLSGYGFYVRTRERRAEAVLSRTR